jgi:exodeoxyribonuclease VII large subunit
VVSAVGHEVDFTIADFVADVRAPTPSAAVELVVPDKSELLRRLERLGAALVRTWRRRLVTARQHLDLMSRRLPDLRRPLSDLRLRLDERGEILVRRLSRSLHDRRQHLRLDGSRLFLLSPGRSLGLSRQRLEQAGQMLFQRWGRGLKEWRRHLDYCQSHLGQLNPLAILERGYAVATQLPEETVIRELIRVRVARGRLDGQVTEVGES